MTHQNYVSALNHNCNVIIVWQLWGQWGDKVMTDEEMKLETKQNKQT